MTNPIERLLNRYDAGTLSRRQLLLSLASLGIAGNAAAQSSQAPMRVRGINHVSIFVEDQAKSVAFYQRLFEMPVMSVQQNGTNLSAGEGNQFLGIYEVPASAPRIDHVCFVVEDFDVDRVMGTLREEGVEPRLRMRENETAEIYFVDPDGISIQIQDVRYCGGGGLLGDQCA